jgi:acetoin utilization deacetylase AcuC-like enzyme
MAVYLSILKPLIETFEPGLVLVSAGFDAHGKDPIGGMHLSSECFGAIAAVIRDAAGEVGAPVIYSLEGGYDLHALKDSVHHVIRVLKGDSPPVIEPTPFPEMEAFLKAHANMWPLAL